MTTIDQITETIANAPVFMVDARQQHAARPHERAALPALYTVGALAIMAAMVKRGFAIVHSSATNFARFAPRDSATGAWLTGGTHGPMMCVVTRAYRGCGGSGCGLYLKATKRAPFDPARLAGFTGIEQGSARVAFAGGSMSHALDMTHGRSLRLAVLGNVDDADGADDVVNAVFGACVALGLDSSTEYAATYRALAAGSATPADAVPSPMPFADAPQANEAAPQQANDAPDAPTTAAELDDLLSAADAALAPLVTASADDDDDGTEHKLDAAAARDRAAREAADKASAKAKRRRRS